MDAQENEPIAGERHGPAPVFRSRWNRYNRPGLIVTFGPYLGTSQSLEAAGALRYARTLRETGTTYQVETEMVPEPDEEARKRAVHWTRWVNALNGGKKWPVSRLTERLDRQVSPDVAVVIVPSHDPFLTDPPLRQLARELAAVSNRTDATGCLVRFRKIKRIAWGGASTAAIHRQSIRVENADLIRDRPVLLLDDIARSGASLRACEKLLYEAGAGLVQSVALGRVVG